MRWDNWYILPVVAEIENDHVKITEQVLPVGKVGVGGEAVAVGKQQTHTTCATVAPHANFGAILKRNLKDHARCGKLEMHEISGSGIE
jgi:hypothetical protein